MLNYKIMIILMTALSLTGCKTPSENTVRLTHGVDASAGGDPAYVITTPSATYYLEKTGGGLSSLLDKDGVDWLGFHKEPGSAHKGEYRGFPNAVHKQDGNFFHAMNASTDPSTSRIDIESESHLRITVTSGNGTWEGQYDFYPDRLDFTMTKVSSDYKYWVQYEGVPGGQMDSGDFRLSSADSERQSLEIPFMADLPAPEWMAFGDIKSPRVLYMLHHEDDNHPDDYAYRPDMTVFAFGRRNKDKFLTTPQKFSVGFIESVNYQQIDLAIKNIAQ